jgi:hypothetical protein
MLQAVFIIFPKVQTSETRTPTICSKIPRENNVNLKMQIHKLSLNEEVRNLDLDRELH